MVLPTATISWTRRPCRLLRWAASLRSPLGFAPPGGQVPLAVLPGEAPPARLLDAPALVIVGRVIGSALAVHLPLEPADGLGIWGQLGTQHAPVVAYPGGERWQWWRVVRSNPTVSLPTACLGL